MNRYIVKHSRSNFKPHELISDDQNMYYVRFELRAISLQTAELKNARSSAGLGLPCVWSKANAMFLPET